ncbi:MAG TPA: type III-A CRISPR-associated protein Cas10/Csm1 [Anaerolineales bacterium]|nr:type III-A CRISPR-associated protein Cas10/Csm1 [Anaerolineales bacterium]
MTERDEKVFLAALAGLLHDVGKVRQRSLEKPWEYAPDLKDSGQPVHATWSIYFANTVVPQKYKAAALAGGYHHQPEKSPAQERFLSKLVALADKLSAGERSDMLKPEKDKKPPQQLVSIFDRIAFDGSQKQKTHYLPLQPLLMQLIGKYVESDKKPHNSEEQVRTDYDTLRQALEESGKKAIAETEAYLEYMLAEMQRLTWCVPSAFYYDVPDVSLYDHSRMTAALAACLVKEEEKKIENLLGAVQRAFRKEPASGDDELLSQEVALLVGGDISGVQDFIYTITNKGATSALRGRSFYLQLLTEAAARFVLRELGLPYTNLIYGGGGNFYLLAQADDAKKLSVIRQKLSRILYKHHQGDLYVAIEGILLKAKDFMRPQEKNPDGTEKRHPLSDKWGELARAVAVVKNRRFAELDENELKILFKPQGHGGNEEKQCQVCGREHPDTRLIKKDKDDEGTRKCPACRSYEKLGEELRKAQLIGWNFLTHPKQVADLTGEEISSGYEEALKDLGFEIEIGETFDKVQACSRIWALSDDAFEKAKDQASGKVLVRRLLVNVTPIISREEILQLQGKVDDLPALDSDNPVKPFGALAYQSQGITRLGVFRADVDNLGKLFAEGLGNDATLSRMASLSFSISLFFEGWVGEVAKSFNEKRRKADEERKAKARQEGKPEKDVPLYGDALYAIYSGGDDLFFVGSWDELVEFAWQVNEDLHKYTGGHPGIHISGGMVLVTEKYPLAKAAKDAEKAENAAKSHAWWDEDAEKAEKPKKKNVFCFLGQPLPWKNFTEAKKLKERLAELDDNKRTAVIRKLLMNYALYAEAEKKRRKAGKDIKPDKKPQTLYGPWNWRIVYLLRRMFRKDSEKMNTNEQTLISDFHTRPDMLEYTGVGARWAELATRNSTLKGEEQ